MVVDMSNNNNNNPPNSRTKDFFASPALSLTLAGIFRDARPAASVEMEMEVEVEEGDEGSGGGGGGRRRDDQTVEISSEYSGQVMRSRSLDEDFDNELGDDHGQDQDNFDENENNKNKNKRKRKKYHRHTAEQIREMEA